MNFINFNWNYFFESYLLRILKIWNIILVFYDQFINHDEYYINQLFDIISIVDHSFFNKNIVYLFIIIFIHIYIIWLGIN